MKMSDRKGQVGETITWIVATLVILFMLIISTYTASLMAEKQKILNIDFGIFEDNSLSQSVFAYLLTENDEGKNVFNQLSNDNDFNSFSENLGKNIFEDISEEGEEVLLRVNSREGSRIFEKSAEEIFPINEEINLEVVENDEITL